MPKPTHNLSPFRGILELSRNGSKKRLLFWGDSQMTVHTNTRLPVGFRDTLPCPAFSFTGHATPTGNDTLCGFDGNGAVSNAVFANHQAATSSPWVGTHLFTPGNAKISPDQWSERQYAADVAADAGPLFRFYARAGFTDTDLFSQFKRGSWLTASFKVRPIIYFDSATQSSSLDAYAYRNGSAGAKNTITSASWTTAGTGTGVKYQDVTCNGNTTDEPRCGIFASTGITETAWSSHGAESSAAALGCVFESTSATQGLGFTFIGNAGHPAGLAAANTLVSDANMEGYLKAVGIPDALVYMLGHNLTATQVTGGTTLEAQWKTDVLADIDWLRARMTAAGATNPIVWLIAPWRTTAAGGYADSVVLAQAQACYEISRDHSSGLVSYTSLADLAMSSTDAVASGYLGVADIHPQNRTAAAYYAGKAVEAAFSEPRVYGLTHRHGR